jgi:hypothetical protein
MHGRGAGDGRHRQEPMGNLIVALVSTQSTWEPGLWLRDESLAKAKILR